MLEGESCLQFGNFRNSKTIKQTINKLFTTFYGILTSYIKCVIMSHIYSSTWHKCLPKKTFSFRHVREVAVSLNVHKHNMNTKRLENTLFKEGNSKLTDVV